MARPAKPNSIENVVARVLKLQEDCQLVDGLIRQGEGLSTLTETATDELRGFFKPYGIEFPDLQADQGVVATGLSRYLRHIDYAARSAVEAVSRLAAKVALVTHGKEDYDPRPYVMGLARLLAGLPVEQLGATPDRLSRGFDELTIRDMVSDLLTADKNSDYEHPFILYLMHPERVGILTTHRNSNANHYGAFLREAFSYVNLLNTYNPLLPYAVLEREIKDMQIAVL